MNPAPHVVFVPLTGLRVREREMLELGMALPGLQRRGAAIGQLPALGLLTLAGLTPEEWTCDYLPVERVDDDTVAQIVAQRPTLVAISALTASVEEAYRLAGRLRAAKLRVVMGGLHVTACPEEARQHCDSVVIGAGEPVWPRLLADARAGALLPIYRSSSYSQQPIWPLPRWDLVRDAPPRFTLQTERGCPFACEFCGASRLLGPFQEKPLGPILAELAAICAISPQPLIELADDNTFAGKRDWDPLLDHFARAEARWFTETDWRIGERPELLASLARAGCVQVLLGIESLVFRYPGMGTKQAELARVMEAVQAIQQAGIAVNSCFIVGAENETRHSLGRLAEFILESPLAEVQLTLQTPFPGTPLYRRMRQDGRLIPERDWSHYTLFDVTYQPDAMRVDELEAGFRELMRTVFSAEASRRRQNLRREIWRRNKKNLDHHP